MNKTRPITFDELDHPGLDEQHRLYWKGQPAETRQRVRLEAWVKVALVAGAFSTAVLTVVEVLCFTGAG